MLHISSTTFSGTTDITLPVRRVRLSPVLFRALFAIEALLIIMALATVARMLPKANALAATADSTAVRAAIYQRASGEIVDPLIEVAPDVRAPASSVRGFVLHGATYYYYFEGRDNFDPYSRGQVGLNQLLVVLRDTGGDAPLVIYMLNR